MARLPLVSILFGALALAGCNGGNSGPGPSSPPPSTGSGNTITGRERLGWTQAGSAGDIAMYQYAAYIDGTRRVLEGVSCAPAAADHDCSVAFPTMSAGAHSIELATFITSGSSVIESPRSSTLQVTLTGAMGEYGSGEPSASRIVASDGLELQAERIAQDLVEPIDLAIDGSGRAFVLERRGTLRIIDTTAGETDPDRERVESLLGPRDQDARVLSIALSRDFTDSHHLFVLTSQPMPESSRIAVTRFREIRGRVGEAAVVVQHEAERADVGAVLRFGPDGTMFVAAGTAAADDGYVLRFVEDGRVPADNPDSSPVYSGGNARPAGLAWHPVTGALWEVESSGAVDRVRVVRPSDRGTAAQSATAAIAVPPAPLLEGGARPSGLTIVGTPASPLFGGLIVSSAGLADLLRFDPERDLGLRSRPARLLQGRFGAIGGVASGPGGAVYFITANHATWGAGNDLLVRLIPAR